MMDRILAMLRDIRPEHNFETSQNFIEEALLDSFDVVTLVAALDETFSISIDGTDILPENFQNLEAIRRLLKKNGARL
jgi:acyl carrier protein